jgi:VWFA-related protein
VTVTRVVITGRVTDSFAKPIPNLTPADFRLWVDGRQAAIESVSWIPGSAGSLQRGVRTQPPEKLRETTISEAQTDTSRARRIVMLFQWEIAGQKDEGFLRMMGQAKRMVETSQPGDLIAVFGFGSSLRLLQDFTTDRAAVGNSIQNIRSTRFRGLPANDDKNSLEAAVANCGPRHSIRKAMICIGRSLQTLPGPKSVMFFGWSLGRPKRDSWFIEYPAMIDAITKANTSVFVLDVSNGYHWLDTALRELAYDTGGLYNGGCEYEMMYCAELATLKAKRAIEGGSYEVVFRDPATTKGWHQVEIELINLAGIPTFSRWYQD